MRRILAIFLMIFSLSFAFTLTSCDNVEVTSPTYTITFEVNGHGEKPADLTEVFAIPEKLPVLTAEGFTFEGWFMDNEFKLKAVAGTKLSNNTTLYAKWTENVVDDPTSEEHTCDFTGEWKKDETHHWHECSCGEIDEKVSHSGGEATETEKAVCEVCGQSYGELLPPPAHECDFTGEWKKDETHHWHECSCGEIDEKVAHSGGEATETEKAVCEVCGQSYGDLKEPEEIIKVYLDINWPKVSEAHFNGEKMTKVSDGNGMYMVEISAASITSFRLDFKEDSVWWHVTKEGISEDEKWDQNYELACNMVAGHNYKVTNVNWAYSFKDETNKWYKCDVVEIHECVFSDEWKSDETGHWHPCEFAGCTQTKGKASHTPTADDNDCTTAVTCSVCNYVLTAALEHDFTGDLQTDETGHWHDCGNRGCTVTDEKASHTPTADDNDCTTAVKCSECDYVTTKALKHNLSEWKSDETGHWHDCMNEGCTTKIGMSNHTPNKDDNDCTTAVKCSECGHITTKALEHDFSGEWKFDDNHHWHECLNDGCTVTDEKLAHNGGEATTTEKAKCDDCGQPYGSILPAPEHTCVFSDEWKSDATHHWHQCDCGEIDGKAEHTPAEAVRENVEEATCKAAGSYEEVVYCSVCKEELSREEKTLEQLEHNLTEVLDGTTLQKECSMCDYVDETSVKTVVLLKPNSNWKVDNARFAVYTFGGPAGEKWINMTYSDKYGAYIAEIPTGYSNIILCRMSPSASANNWNNKWNQTADLTMPTNGYNCYTVKEGTWDKGGGTWSKVS